MPRRARSWLATLVIVGVAGPFLFGNAAAAGTGTPQAPVSALGAAPATSDAATIATVTLTPTPNECPIWLGCTPPPPPPRVISCSISVEDPVLNGDRVFALGKAQCGSPVPKIRLTVDLKNNGAVVNTQERVVENQASVSVDTTHKCTNSSWQAIAKATITPPSGYTINPASQLSKGSMTKDIFSPLCVLGPIPVP